ncbi:MAG: acetyl-CoA C-acetyltransferase [Chloroflexi bacterium]|nr:acetyl-CoA C-acetyltransferase [Chloroflexota bacterium]
MREAVVISPVRTPVGDLGGTLKDITAVDLAALVVKEVLARTGVPPQVIDDVVMGQAYPSGENPDIGRLAALRADLPIEVPGCQVDRRCASGLQAFCFAAMMVQTGAADVVVAGGVESMSQAEHYLMGLRWGIKRGSPPMYDRLERTRITISCPERFGIIQGMIATAENVAEKYNISREEQDEYALHSHRKACAAIEAGKFKNEIVPFPIPQRRGEPLLFAQDEHPRPDTSLEKLARLNPIQGKTVTAGNSSSENDAAAACLVMTREKAEEFGLKPIAHLKSWATAGVHPAYMGIGPVPAVKKALDKAGLTLEDMDLIELNEAFAAQALGVLREWHMPFDHPKLNVNGSGISLGHPIGATGARIMATLLNEMERHDAQFGLETMCVGGGQGMAAIFQRR